MRKTLLYSTLILMLWSCGNTNQSSTFSNNTIDSTNTENSKIEVDYTQLAVIQTNDEIFQFKAPKDLFVEKANEKNVFLSEKLHATIHFILTETGQVDAPDAIRQKEDLILSMKKNLEVTLVNEKEMIVSGKLNDNMISYRKGIYFKPKDNHFGELGKNTQPYCFTGTLILDYPAHVQAEMDILIPIISDSFKGNFSSLFTEY